MADKSLKGHGLGSKSLADSQGVELAARQEISFDCPNGHHFTLTFAMEAELPTEWECPRCGQPSRRSDGVEPEVKETKAPRTLVLDPNAYPSALVLANFKDKDVDTLLDLMKQAQVNIPLKALVTPSNKNWVFGDLLAHLQEEHTAFTAAKETTQA